MLNKKEIRYSEPFKLQVIEQLESGHFTSPQEAARAYNIKGTRTIHKWLKSYDRDHLIPKHIKIMSKNEIDETTQLKRRVRELERSLADTYMLGALSESYLNIACERLKMDPEEFKKKHAAMLSKGLNKK